MIYPSLKKTTKYIMRIGIDLIDLVPKNNQGINVYSENLVKGFIKFNKKIKLQIYVSKKYFEFAKKNFKGKNTEIIIYSQQFSYLKILILKFIVLISILFFIKKNKLYKLFKNYFFRDLKHIIEKKSDILICPNVILNYYGLNLRTILCIHDIQHEYLPKNFNSFQLTERKITRKLSADYCTKLIASSKFLKDQCSYYLNKNKNDIDVIEEGVDFDLFKNKKYKNNLIRNFYLPDKYLFYPAAFWRHKNHIFLLKAIKNLKSQKINLVLCGLKKNFFTQVKEYMVKNKMRNVHYIGDLSKQELIKAYKFSHAVIIPSLEESSCLLVKEAVGFKKPLLCSNTKTFLEKSKSFKILFFNKNNLKDLENKIKKIYNKKTTSKKFINSNFKKLESFKWLNVSKKYFDLCKKVY